MSEEVMDIDIERLRSDLCDYFGTAMNSVSYLAITELTKVESAGDFELVDIALENGVDLQKYFIKTNKISR